LRLQVLERSLERYVSTSLCAGSESFSLLYLNPPYDSEIGSAGNSRMERLFLEHTYRWLVMDGDVS
jgi:hypothetical protein